MLGDINKLEYIYDILSDQFSLTRFVESKYLRFWSGKSSDIQRIWSEVAFSLDALIKEEQLPLLLSKLDTVSLRIREEMEKESLAWMEEDLEYDMLLSFFQKHASGSESLLAFKDFIAWDKITGEMWYNAKSLSKESIGGKWCDLCGNLEKSIDFDQFCFLYRDICSTAYTV